MEDKRNEQNREQESHPLHKKDNTGGVRTSGHVEDTSNPVNSGGEPTIDTENKAAVAQTRSPSSRIRGTTTKKFITGSDSDGQL